MNILSEKHYCPQWVLDAYGPPCLEWFVRIRIPRYMPNHLVGDRNCDKRVLTQVYGRAYFRKELYDEVLAKLSEQGFGMEEILAE